MAVKRSRDIKSLNYIMNWDGGSDFLYQSFNSNFAASPTLAIISRWTLKFWRNFKRMQRRPHFNFVERVFSLLLANRYKFYGGDKYYFSGNMDILSALIELKCYQKSISYYNCCIKLNAINICRNTILICIIISSKVDTQSTQTSPNVEYVKFQ